MDEPSIVPADKTKRELAVPYAENLARKMLDIPEGMKVAIVSGKDGEGKVFYSFSDPVIDILSLSREQQMDLRRTMVEGSYTWEEVVERKKIVVPRYRNVVGFIRFPLELVKRTQERKITPSNYKRIIEALIQEIVNNPERWITEI